MPDQTSFDLAVVGAGIVGLACALAAAKRGKRVVVLDRDAQANGASVRNFGFITITGQAGDDGEDQRPRPRQALPNPVFQCGHHPAKLMRRLRV